MPGWKSFIGLLIHLTCVNARLTINFLRTFYYISDGDTTARTRKNPLIRKQEILDTALQLFLEKGYQNIVIGDIAEKSGIARTTFYEYYTNKEQILVELVDRVANKVHEIVPQGESCREKLVFIATNILREIQENRQVYYLIFREAPVFSGLVSENLVRWRQSSSAQIRHIITDGTKELAPEINQEDATFAFQALIGQRAGDILITGEEINAHEEAKRLINILWSGISK